MTKLSFKLTRDSYFFRFTFNIDSMFHWEFFMVDRYDCNFYSDLAQQLPRLYK